MGDQNTPGSVIVDQPLTSVKWYVIVNKDGNSALYTKKSGGEENKINAINLTFNNDDYIFEANIRTSKGSDYDFQEYNPINVGGLSAGGTCLSIISLSNSLKKLTLCFRCELEENAALTFNMVKDGGDPVVSHDPSISIVRR